MAIEKANFGKVVTIALKIKILFMQRRQRLQLRSTVQALHFPSPQTKSYSRLSYKNDEWTEIIASISFSPFIPQMWRPTQ